MICIFHGIRMFRCKGCRVVHCLKCLAEKRASQGESGG
jgi:hypothetical protein